MYINKLCFCAAALIACATFPRTLSAAEASVSGDSSAPPLYRPWMLSLEAGTTGIGVGASWRFDDHFGVRAGVNGLQYSDSGFAIKDLRFVSYSF